jgi:hypothetical protein
MLTVSQLSKSFAGRALFDDVSIEEFFGLAAGNSRRYGCQGHEFAFGDRSR